MTVLRFHFDFVSPYAYLAWTQLPTFAAEHRLELVPEPVVFGALLSHNGTRGPAEVPARRAYLFRDVVRLAHQLQVPLQPPPAHPFNPLLGLRLASLDLAPAERRRLIDALFAAVWAGGPGITEVDTVTRLVASLGLDGPALLAAAHSEPIKQQLRHATDRAIARGVFGVPTLIIERPGAADELFWGLDSLPHIARFLAGDDPITPELEARFATLPVGIVRKV